MLSIIKFFREPVFFVQMITKFSASQICFTIKRVGTLRTRTHERNFRIRKHILISFIYLFLHLLFFSLFSYAFISFIHHFFSLISLLFVYSFSDLSSNMITSLPNEVFASLNSLSIL